jgi:hypothetical protein
VNCKIKKKESNHILFKNQNFTYSNAFTKEAPMVSMVGIGLQPSIILRKLGAMSMPINMQPKDVQIPVIFQYGPVKPMSSNPSGRS